jgi:hypothetical protein
VTVRAGDDDRRAIRGRHEPRLLIAIGLGVRVRLVILARFRVGAVLGVAVGFEIGIAVQSIEKRDQRLYLFFERRISAGIRRARRDRRRECREDIA